MEITKKERQGVLFYSCDRMTQAGFPNGFSTRVGGVSPAPWDSLNLGATLGDQPERVAENIRRFCGAVGVSCRDLVKNHQVHGDRVRPVTAADRVELLHLPGTEPADGLTTDQAGVALMAFSADCVPVLLCDPVKGVVAAVHSGWRGTALGIAARAVERMGQTYGSRPQDILAAIGPGISLCCFETDGDVPQGLRQGLGDRAEEFIHPDAGGKYHVDLKGAIRRWLLDAGVPEGQIALCPACTACGGTLFWSHRRLGRSRGSLAAVIQRGCAGG